MHKKIYIYLKKRKMFILDSVGVGIFLCILAVFFIFFSRKADSVIVLLDVTRNENLSQNFVDVYDNVPFWFAEKLTSTLTKKDSMTTQNGLKINHVYFPNDGAKTTNVLLEIQVPISYDEKNGEYLYNGMPLLIGNTQRFTIGTIVINGVIRDVFRPSEKKNRERTVRIIGYLEPLNYPPFTLGPIDRVPITTTDLSDGIPSYISQKIQQGMDMKDALDHTVARIGKVTKTQAKKTIYTGIYPIILSDEEREKVVLELDVQVMTYGDKQYFMGTYPVMIGSVLPLAFDTLRLPVTITDIQY